MQIKPKREYFCYAGHRIQSALREVWGLKGVMKILVPVSERERARALTLVDPPWPSQSRVHIPGCSVHKRLLPWNHGIRNRSSRLQPELVLACSHLLLNPRFHFDIVSKLFIHTVGLLQKTLALETSSAPKLIPPGCLGIGWNHRRPALQIPGPSTDSCSHQPGPVILWSLR